MANAGLAAVRDELAGQIEAINRKRKAEQARAAARAHARTHARTHTDEGASTAGRLCVRALPPYLLPHRWTPPTPPQMEVGPRLARLESEWVGAVKKNLDIDGQCMCAAGARRRVGPPRARASRTHRAT